MGVKVEKSGKNESKRERMKKGPIDEIPAETVAQGALLDHVFPERKLNFHELILKK